MGRMLRRATRLPSPPRPLEPRRASPAAVWAALGSVYVIWGSTYLAIRYAIDTIPPLLMASVRFLAAGAALYAVAVRRGDREGDRLGRREWRAAVLVGGLLLLGGNGGVSWAEQRVPTGVVWLIIATIPRWMALLDRLLYRQRLAPPAVAGLVLGFGGLALLVGDPGRGRIDPLGAAVCLVAALSWSVGSLYARRAPRPARPLVGTGMEMLAGGVLLGLAGLALGEAGHLHPARVSTRSLLGLGFLIVFGSWVAFSAYVWLLRSAPTSLVSTYAYVNPVVAVLLGRLFLREAVTWRVLVAGAVIVAAVALILAARRIPPGDAADAAPDAECLQERGPG
jgi:drug/metabolite transporter (DMT)-like permease